MKSHNHSGAKKKIAACLVILAAAVWWWWPQGPREEPSAGKQAPQRPPSMRDLSEAETPRTSGDQEVAEPKRATPSPKAIYLHKYLDWFESICPSLTTEEEDRLLEKTGRSPEMLTVLALMRSSRRQAFLEEALQADPPPPIAIHAAQKNASFKGDKLELAAKLDGAYSHLYRALELSKKGGAPSDIVKALEAAAKSPEKLTPWIRAYASSFYGFT